jgi:hypothetical protein
MFYKQLTGVMAKTTQCLSPNAGDVLEVRYIRKSWHGMAYAQGCKMQDFKFSR